MKHVIKKCFCGRELTPNRGTGGCIFWECVYCKVVLDFTNAEEAAKWETKENSESDNQ